MMIFSKVRLEQEGIYTGHKSKKRVSNEKHEIDTKSSGSDLLLENIDDDPNDGFEQQLISKQVTKTSFVKSTQVSSKVTIVKPSKGPQTFGRVTSPQSFSHTKISSMEASGIRSLLLGPLKSMHKSWTRQGFPLSKTMGLEYGIVQHEGGPCGVIAAVQSYLLKELFHSKYQNSEIQHPQNIRRYIPKVLATILFHKVGKSQGCRLVIGDRLVSHLFEVSLQSLNVVDVTSFEAAEKCISNYLTFFSDSFGIGVLLLVLSAILTRGVENIKKDMDNPNGSLIVEHGYCSQELVNLLIIGEATSNVFDSEKVVSGTVLKGIYCTSDVGFLSLLETFNYLKVGKNYKNPHFPVWIIYSESHYSTLFAKGKLADFVQSSPNESNNDIGSANVHQHYQLVNQTFDLYYYDSLANQDEEIKLTIRTAPSRVLHTKKDICSPLEEVIRSKWQNCLIDWNGTEPLL